jgi:hypothetical protein
VPDRSGWACGSAGTVALTAKVEMSNASAVCVMALAKSTKCTQCRCRRLARTVDAAVSGL